MRLHSWWQISQKCQTGVQFRPKPLSQSQHGPTDSTPFQHRTTRWASEKISAWNCITNKTEGKVVSKVQSIRSQQASLHTHSLEASINSSPQRLSPDRGWTIFWLKCRTRDQQPNNQTNFTPDNAFIHHAWVRTPATEAREQVVGNQHQRCPNKREISYKFSTYFNKKLTIWIFPTYNWEATSQATRTLVSNIYIRQNV